MGTEAPVHANGASHEAGFTLIEVLVATALFVFVALAGFEVLRQLGSSVDLLAQRAGAAAQLDVAAGMLRSDALSSVAVWKPASTCGDAVEFMQRNAGGTSFLLYVAKASALVRAGARGPMDPCDPA
ncbi:MAG TPA: prepilin-type N-terminal cleavage/methylation domain-containing protein, partial [Candidatus Lustribacter sp.]